MPRPKQSRGFTLIELLVVIAIIGLLMTLLVPAVTKANEMVRAIRTRGILKDLSVALENFKIDFGDYPPSRPNTYFGAGGTKPGPVYKIVGTQAGRPESVAFGDMGTGAANLVYYLYGPDRVGWGTVGGGAMPFGGPAQRAYGPYYQCAEDGVRLEKLSSSFTVRGQSLPFAATGFLDAYKPPGIILYLRSYKREMKDSTGHAYTIQGYDPTDNDRPDINLRKSDTDYTKYNYGEPQSGKKQQDLFDLAIGAWGRVAGSTQRTELKRYPRQDYVLISPGPDGRYGYVNQTTLEPWDPNTGDEQHDGLAQFDDVGNWEK
jgi:prepilin-type N-terminal cleavage/methylation domain-containing protein